MEQALSIFLHWSRWCSDVLAIWYDSLTITVLIIGILLFYKGSYGTAVKQKKQYRIRLMK